MPTHLERLPEPLVAFAQDTAEAWLFEQDFRCILEEWVSAEEAGEALSGVLWSGFCLRGQELQSRLQPIPVLVEVMYRHPLPANENEVSQFMRQYFHRAAVVWERAREQYGDDVRSSP